MGERGIDVAAAQDHVVPEDPAEALRGRPEGEPVPQDERDLAEGVDPAPLGEAVPGRDDHPVEGRVDRFAPAVALAGGDADDQGPQPAGGVVAALLVGVEADEVERVALGQHVGPVAGDPAPGGVDGHPLAAQGEVDDAGTLELRRRPARSHAGHYGRPAVPFGLTRLVAPCHSGPGPATSYSMFRSVQVP